MNQQPESQANQQYDFSKSQYGYPTSPPPYTSTNDFHPPQPPYPNANRFPTSPPPYPDVSQYPGYPPQNPNANQFSTSPPTYLNARQFNQHQTSAPYMTDSYSPDGNGATFNDAFTEKKIRHAFIRKVYLVLFLQLLVTCGIICIFTYVDSVKSYVRHHQEIYWASYVVFIVVYIAITCVTSLRRKVPWNFVALLIFTLSLSYMTGCVASYHSTKSVIMAAGITVAVTLAVVLFTFQTKYDITECGGVLFMLSIVLFSFGFLCIFTHDDVLETVYSALAALVFTLLLAYDTKTVIGGGKYELSEEEYIFATVQLYVDIAMIFIAILGISGD